MNYNNNYQPMQVSNFNNKLVTPPEGCKTLWAGDLHGCDENYVKSMFGHVGEVISVKLIKDKITQQPMGYGFVEFATQYMAQQALQLNGTTVGYTGRFYRLNWAKTIPNQQPQPIMNQQNFQFQNQMIKPNPTQLRQPMQPMINQPKMQIPPHQHPIYNQHMMQSPQIVYPNQPIINPRFQQQQPVMIPDNHEIGEFSVFVGDLGPEVNDYMLRHAFSRYKSLVSARVIYDPINNLSKMFGFVSFNDINDYHSALAHMGGTIVGTRPIKVNTAKKEKAQLEQQYIQKINQQYYFNQPNTIPNPNQRFNNMNMNIQNPVKEIQINDNPTNTVIFVAHLSIDTTEEDLFRLFHPYGEIKSIKLSPTKDCAFIEYFKRDDAKKAFALDGTILDNKKIYINWGHGTDLNTMNNRFKSMREEKTVSHIPVPSYYQQTNFQEPFNVHKSNQHFMQQNYPSIQPIQQNYLNQVVPLKTDYKNYYY